MRGTLISIDAWNRSTASRQTVRVGAALNSTTLGVGGYTWEPRLSRRPRLSMQLADDDLTGTVQLGQGEFALNAAALRFPDSASPVDPMQLDWIGSTLRIYSGDGYTLSDMRQEFVGRVVGGVTDATTGIAPLTIEVDKAIVDVALLTQTYGGGGGADGDVELRGNFKPAGFGSPVNIRPVLINETLNIYQVDAYNNTRSIADVFEDAASFGASAGDYATYAALAAATITEGQWATCIAEGLFRLGADPTGTITCDPVFGADMPGSMMMRWLTVHAGVAAARIRDDTFDALTAAVKAVAGQDPYVDYWTTEEGNVLDLMQRMCASCNAVVLLLLDGTIAVSRAIGGATVMTLNRQGGTPTVTDWAAGDQPRPWWRMRMTAARSYYVNSPAEIDYEDDVRDMGDYSASETYRQGMVARGSDGARYIYKNATPSSGNAPPNAAYWDIYEDAPDATTIKYPSGYTLAQLEPGEKGANITETRVSSSITGQGAFATLSQVAYGSGYLTGFGQLSPLNSITFGGNYLFESGSILATLNNFKTILGISSGISGQGAFATKDSVGYGSSFLTGFGALSPLNNILFGSSFLQESAGVSATLNNFKTILGVAASITGQGGLATKSTIGSAELGNVGDLANLAYNGKPTLSANWGSPNFIADDPTNAFNGARFVFKGPPDASQRYNGNSNRFAVTPGEKLFMSFMGKVDAQITGTARAYLRVNDRDGKQVGTPAPGQLSSSTTVGTWLPFSNEITVPDTGVEAFVQVYFGNTDGGTAYISDIVLLRKTAANQLVNAGVLQQYLAGNAVRLGTNVVRSDNATAVTDATAITSLGTASGIAGQGAFATLNSAAYGSNLLTGFGALAPLAAVTFGSNYLLESAGTPATLARFRTADGTAAGISGQGAFATLNSAAYGSNLLTGFGALAPLANITFGSNFLLETAGTPATLAAFKTIQGTAAGITGQGSLATKSSVALDSDVTDGTTYKRYAATEKTKLATMASYASPPSDNLLTDPRFVRAGAGDLSGWKTGSAGVSYPMQGEAGDACLRLDAGGAIRDVLTPYNIPVAAGDTIYATIRVFMSTDLNTSAGNRNAILSATLLKPDTSNPAASYPTAAGQAGVPLGQWVTLSGKFTVPTGYTIFQPRISMRNDATAGYILVDWVSYSRGEKEATVGAIYGTNLLETGGGTLATLANFKTALGTASGISGQGVFATLSSISSDTHLSGVMANRLAPFAGDLNYLQAARLAWSEGDTVQNYKPQEKGANITENRTASAITGQGSFATISAISADSQFSGVMANRFAPYAGDANYLSAARLAWNEGGTVQGMKPQEGGANITENRTASAITGQGSFATKSAVSMNGNDIVDRYASYLFYGSDGANAGSVQSFKPQEAGANVTENRTASAITGQGAFATVSSAAFGSPLLTGFGNIAGLGNIMFGDDYLLERANTKATLPNFRTIEGISAGITNQGTGATASTLTGLNSGEGTKLAGIDRSSTRGENLIRNADYRDLIAGTSSPAQVFSQQGTTTFVPPAGAVTGYFENKATSGTSDNFAFNAGATSPGIGFSTEWPIIEAGQKLFTSIEVATSGARRVQVFARAWTAAGAAATPTNIADFTVDTAGAWVVRKATPFVMPSGYVYLQFYAVIFTSVGTYTRLRNMRVSRVEDAATLGADANANIIDSGNGNALLTRTQLVTALGTAQAITGQGALATSTLTAAQVTNSGISISAAGVLSGAGGGTVTYSGVGGKAMGLQDRIYYGQSFLYEESSFSTIATLANFKTSQGTASAIAGQGTFATLSNLSTDSQLAGTLAQRLAPFSGDASYLQASRLAWSQGDTVENYKPQERGANVTENRTASAITGQGALATKTTADYGADVSGAGKPDTYRIMARGNAVSSPPSGFVVGLSRGDGSNVWTYYARSYSVIWYDRSSKVWNGRNFDVYGSSSDYGYGTGDGNTGPTAMATHLNNIPLGSPVVVYSSDEPRSNRMNGGLPAAMYRCGASRTRFGANNWRSHGAYILVGMAGAGEGGASAELYYDAGADGSNQSFQIASFNMIDGRIQAGARAINTADELQYATGATVGSLRPGEAGANITENRIAASISGQGALATANNIGADSQLAGTIAARLQPFAGDPNYLGAGRIAWAQGDTLEAYKPQDKGANVTENRTAAGITNQAWAATNGSQDRADNQRVGVGSNGLVDTEFAQGNALWRPIWGGNAGGSPTRGINFTPSGGEKYWGANAVIYMYLPGTPSAGSAHELAASGPSEDARYFVPVKPGDNVYVAAMLAPHRSNGQTNVHWYNAAGSYLTENAWTGGRQGGGLNGDPNNFDTVGGFVTAPANAAFACLRIRNIYNGGQEPYLFAMRPQITVCPAGQTAPPPYTPGNGDKRADRTGANTAAAISGQGAFATMNSAAFGSPQLTGFGNIAALGNIMFGDAYLLEAAGTRATNANYKTIQGTSAGITGQGSFATKSVVSMNSNDIVDRYASNLYYGSDGANTGSVQSFKPQEANANVTENRTASAISGQGAFATVQQITRANIFQQSLFSLNAFSLNYSITREDGTTKVTESMAITELGIASAVTNQGSLATLNSVSTGQIGANAVTAPAWMAVDYGGGMGNFPLNSWTDYDTATGGGGGGTGGGSGGGGGGTSRNVNLQ